MRVLITGGTGFLGSVLIKDLASSWEIYAVVRKIPLWAGDFPNVSWIEGDLSSDFSQLVLPGEIDAVCHLAQSPYYRDFPERANHVFAINIASTQYLLDYAVKAGASRFLYTSSGSVYEPYDDPLVETKRLAPASYYSVSKLTAEYLAQPYQNLMSVSLLRMFNLYGPDQEDKLIPGLIERVKNGIPITLFGGKDGMVIAPTLVSDAAKICALSLEEGFSGVYNVASAESVSLRELAEQIGQLIGCKPVFEHKEGPAPVIVPDTTRLNTRFAQSRFTSLREGLKQTLNTG